jgi:hypothetical protein
MVSTCYTDDHDHDDSYIGITIQLPYDDDHDGSYIGITIQLPYDHDHDGSYIARQSRFRYWYYSTTTIR